MGSYRTATWRLVRLLSLDVAVGVVCGAALAVATTGARPPGTWWIVLPLSAWVVYAADHLLDARRLPPGTGASRHAFHRRHARVLAPLTVAVALLAAGLARLSLSGELWLPSCILAAGVGAYLLLGSRARLGAVKEVLAAALYTAAIWFVPLSAVRPGRAIVALVALHYAAALLNLLLFALFERQTDARAGMPSLPLLWGERFTRRTIHVLTSVGLVAAAGLFVTGPPRIAASALALAVPLSVPELLLLLRSRVQLGERYRLLGDAAFLALALPLCLRLWAQATRAWGG